MSRALRIVLIALAALVLFQWWSSRHEVTPEPAPVSAESSAQAPSAAGYPDFLPPEAIETLQAIEQGGPFPYSRDGVTFQNRERRLPEKPRGYYREYTVPTPGSLSARMRPPCASTMVRAIDSPSPMPRCLVLKNESNSFGRCSDAMP